MDLLQSNVQSRKSRVQKLKGVALKAAFVEIRLSVYWLHTEEHLV